jgi:hypothetical protein
MKRWFPRVDKRLLAIATTAVAVIMVAIVVVAAMPGGLTLFRGTPVAAAHKPHQTPCTPVGVASYPSFSAPSNSY